jgi:hypothetical protein
MKRNFALIIISICASATGILASDTGTNSGILLRQDISARSTALGNTFAAGSGDIASLFYNPAGISGVKSNEVTLSYSTKLVDTAMGFFGYTFARGDNYFAAGYSSLDSGKINFVFTDGTGYESTGLRETLLSLAYSRKLSANMSAGASIKSYSSALVEKYNTSAVAVDAGIIYTGDGRVWGAGLALQNNGSEVKYEARQVKLPATIRAGIFRNFKIVVRPREIYEDPAVYGINVSADILQDGEGSSQFSAGGEFVYQERYFFRAGLKSGNDADSISAGFGTDFTPKTSLNYSFGFRPSLGNIHCVSLSVRF